MKAWRQKWLRALISVISYVGLAWIAVVGPWLTQTGEERFNALVRDPMTHPWEITGLAVGLAGATFGAVKSLMNRDWPKDEANGART